MFGLFTLNLDSKKKTGKKNTKGVGELNLSRIDKKELLEYLGGNLCDLEKMKKRTLFLDLFCPGPCEGDLPQ